MTERLTYTDTSRLWYESRLAAHDWGWLFTGDEARRAAGEDAEARLRGLATTPGEIAAFASFASRRATMATGPEPAAGVPAAYRSMADRLIGRHDAGECGGACVYCPEPPPQRPRGASKDPSIL